MGRQRDFDFGNLLQSQRRVAFIVAQCASVYFRQLPENEFGSYL
jgi:hypothetical protein